MADRTFSDVLAEHQPRFSRHTCTCGWEGDRFDVHLHDVIFAPENRVLLVGRAVEAGTIVLDHTDQRQCVSGDVTVSGDGRRWWIEDVPLYRIGGTDG